MNQGRRKRNESWDTRVLSFSPRQRHVRRFRLEVTHGPDRGVVAVSKGDELSVGTADANELVLTDGSVSRHHLLITLDEQGALLTDLGSTNGTTLAGFRVLSAYLETGATLAAGETTLRFDYLDDEIVEPLAAGDSFGDALGQSREMRRVFAVLQKAAPSEATVLLEGETGTGKGVLAEALHGASARADQPFVVLDCAAVPASLIESELFGHERGAFTGADTARAGIFEAANGGTLFVDEIGELPLELQPKLLRALERGAVTRVGSTTPIPIDVRFVAATNRDLRREVNAGRFRADLFYRLSTLRVQVPPLRERSDDIPALVAHFYRELSGQDDEPPAELLLAAVRQSWPGNVRELRSYVERSLVLGRTDKAETAAPGGRDFSDSFRDAKSAAVDEWQADYVAELIAAYGGNLSRAARAVKMDRNHLRDLLKRYDIDY